MKPVIADAAAIENAAEILRQGKLVAIPTETVYGLGADAKNPAAVKKIFAAKGRPSDHPLIVHIADAADLPAWAIDIPPTAYLLAKHFWPGPLTLVLNKHLSVPYEVTGGQETIALRVPDHPVALSLLKAFGGGIAAPSANRFCRISPTQASHVEEELGDKVDMILDGGACQVGLESTIVDLSGAKPRLLRPGQLPQADIEEILGMPFALPDEKEQIHAPGMMEVHYAPVTPTLLCSGKEIEEILRGKFSRNKGNTGVLAFGGQTDCAFAYQVIPMPADCRGYAQNLYNSLRIMDNAGIGLILIEQPPLTEEWRAINDRLIKAGKKYSSDSALP
jgi:L-threonylcarbamoyladenylate synthase